MNDPSILLIDDGDLQEAKSLLDELDVEYEHIRGSKHRGPLPDPEKLLITTSRLALALECRRGPKVTPERAVWIAFLHGESRTQRQVLERAGFDFMVRQPVHPSALRLLLQRALYSGEESRRNGRVAFGYNVSVKLGIRSHRATLTDLSPGGCRLLLGRSLANRQKVRVRIPAEVAGGQRLDLPGIIVRSGVAEREGGTNGEMAYGLRFERLDRVRRNRLRDLLLAHSSGPAVLREPVSSGGRASGRPRGESRAHPRKSFEGKITAVGGNSRAETHHVLLGRDISLGGMRIEPEPTLSLEDEIRLAVQPPGGSDLILIEATVVRDDGESGMALRFEWIDPQSEPILSEMIGSLPAIESLHDASGGTILTRVLSSFRST